MNKIVENAWIYRLIPASSGNSGFYFMTKNHPESGSKEGKKFTLKQAVAYLLAKFPEENEFLLEAKIPCDENYKTRIYVEFSSRGNVEVKETSLDDKDNERFGNLAA